MVDLLRIIYIAGNYLEFCLLSVRAILFLVFFFFLRTKLNVPCSPCYTFTSNLALNERNINYIYNITTRDKQLNTDTLHVKKNYVKALIFVKILNKFITPQTKHKTIV